MNELHSMRRTYLMTTPPREAMMSPVRVAAVVLYLCAYAILVAATYRAVLWILG